MEMLFSNSPRLLIRPYCSADLVEYYHAFNKEITKYQYPDPFPSLEAAQELLDDFVLQMNRGEMLELVLLSPSGEFLGSMEAHGLKEQAPELGIWLKAEAQGQGYGYEALSRLIAYLNETGKYPYYIYEADRRNLPSIRLARKFSCTQAGYQEITTDSGKQLCLQEYHIQMDPPCR